MVTTRLELPLAGGVKALNNRLSKLIVTLFFVGTMIGSIPGASYAAGFWNYTPYTVFVYFIPEGCPGIASAFCREEYSLPPYQNGIPGSRSTNNAGGWVEIGYPHPLLRDDRLEYKVYDSHQTYIERQDYITFGLVGDDVIRVRIHRSDTGKDEYAELTFWEMWAGPIED